MKLLSDAQNGFRKGKNTTRAIYQALCKILDSLNNKKHTLTMCLDLSKAFDSVDHIVLINKLENYGVRGVALALIKSYLQNRKQRVVEKDKLTGTLLKSDEQQIERGVPQGSILGPLLYILYTNELPEAINQDIIQFADDTSIIFSEENEANIEKNVFGALNTLEKWFSKNNLMLNINKTQIIKFSQKTNNNVILTNGAINLATSSSISFLGIEIDSRLDWKKQIEKLSLNIAHYCYALRVLSNSIGKFAAINVYHAYIQSRLRYGIIFWATSTDSNKIFILQKRCLRAVFGLRQIESCKMVFVENKVLTLYSLYLHI